MRCPGEERVGQCQANFSQRRTVPLLGVTVRTQVRDKGRVKNDVMWIVGGPVYLFSEEEFLNPSLKHISHYTELTVY